MKNIFLAFAFLLTLGLMSQNGLMAANYNPKVIKVEMGGGGKIAVKYKKDKEISVKITIGPTTSKTLDVNWTFRLKSGAKNALEKSGTCTNTSSTIDSSFKETSKLDTGRWYIEAHADLNTLPEFWIPGSSENNLDVVDLEMWCENNVFTDKECMEGRVVTFYAKANGAATDEDKSFVFSYDNPDGTHVDNPEDDSNNWEDLDVTMPQVPDGDADHKYTFPMKVKLQYRGEEMSAHVSYGTDETLNIDVFELFIDEFMDKASSKAWKVVVGQDIQYKAIASKDCTDWKWDMEDGVPDAWNPTGGNLREGNAMSIPFSDLERAGKSWFGDVYGTVTVTCKDGEGRTITAYSTDVGNRKAKVFFPADVSQKNLPPDQDNPPCWYVFWKNGAVPGLEDAGWNYQQPDPRYPNSANYGESEFVNGWWFLNRTVLNVCNHGGGYPIAPTGSHYSSPIVINGRSFGGPSVTGIDCCAEVIAHEKFHNQQKQLITEDDAVDSERSGNVNEGDLLVDSLEPTYGTIIGNRDTFGVQFVKHSDYWRYGDGEYAAMIAGNGGRGVQSKDWSWKGKQW